MASPDERSNQPQPSSDPPSPPSRVPVERRSRHFVGWRAVDILKAAAVVIGLYLAIRLLWLAYPLVFTAFLGVLFGLAVSSGVDKLQRFRLPRGLAAALIVFGFIGVLGLVMAVSAPVVREQSRELRSKLPQAIDNVDQWLESHRGGLLGMLIDGDTSVDTAAPTGGVDTAARDRVDSAAVASPDPSQGGGAPPGRARDGREPAVRVTEPAERLQRSEQSADSARARESGERSAAPGNGARGGIRDQIQAGLARARTFLFSFVSSTFTAIAGFLLVMVITIYVAAEPDVYHRGLMHLFPHYSRQRAGEVLSVTAMTLRRWLKTQLIAMIVIGVITTIALLILGIPAAIPLGILAGLLEFIPTIGPVISAVPAVLMGFVVSPEKALIVALVYWGIQLAENYLLIPRLMKEGMDLPPVLTIMAQALMALIFGFIGLLVAVPLLAAVVVMVKMLYVEGVVGDDVDLGAEDA